MGRGDGRLKELLEAEVGADVGEAVGVGEEAEGGLDALLGEAGELTPQICPHVRLHQRRPFTNVPPNSLFALKEEEECGQTLHGEDVASGGLQVEGGAECVRLEVLTQPRAQGEQLRVVVPVPQAIIPTIPSISY